MSQLKSIESQISYFDSLTTQVEVFKDFFEGRKINLGFYNENQSLGLLITFNLGELAQEKDFKELLSQNLKCEVNAEGLAEFWKDRLKYTIQVSNGVVAISESLELIKKCFNAAEKKLSKEPKFLQLRKNLDEDDLCNVYFNYDLLKKSNLKINAQQIALTGVSSAKLEVTPDAIVMNGFNDADTSTFLNALSGQPPKTVDFFLILPGISNASNGSGDVYVLSSAAGGRFEFTSPSDWLKVIFVVAGSADGDNAVFSAGEAVADTGRQIEIGTDSEVVVVEVANASC